jgi:hypothetical protein
LALAFATAFLLLGSALVIAPASASCNPAIMQGALQRQAADAQAAAAHAAAIYNATTTQPSFLTNSDGMLTACSSNNWPTISISNPILSQLMNGAEQEAVKTACNKARQVVAQGANVVQNYTGSIRGYLQQGQNMYQQGGSSAMNLSAGARAISPAMANWANPSSGAAALGELPDAGAAGIQGQSWTSLPGTSAVPGVGAASAPSDPSGPSGVPGVSVQ